MNRTGNDRDISADPVPSYAASGDGWQPIETAPKDGTVGRVPLTKGRFATVDLDDLEKVVGRCWQAHERSDGKGWYAVSDGLRMHRLIVGATDNEIVDHVNGDGLDNRRMNLRRGNQSLNSVNRKTTPGAYLRGARPQKGKWRSYIKHGGRQRSLGYYDTELEAHQAYLTEAKRLYGDWMPLPAPPLSCRRVG